MSEPATGPVRTRTATLDDAVAIARVHVHGWEAAHARHMPDDLLEELSVDARADGWRAQLADDTLDVFVAVDGDEVVGFAAVGIAPPEQDTSADPEPAHTGEVRAIYVDPPRWGQGIGRKLLGPALDQLRRSGAQDATLWVIVENVPARRFYERAGWAVDGATRSSELGGLDVNEVRYRIDL